MNDILEAFKKNTLSVMSLMTFDEAVLTSCSESLKSVKKQLLTNYAEIHPHVTSINNAIKIIANKKIGTFPKVPSMKSVSLSTKSDLIKKVHSSIRVLSDYLRQTMHTMIIRSPDFPIRLTSSRLRHFSGLVWQYDIDKLLVSSKREKQSQASFSLQQQLPFAILFSFLSVHKNL